MEGVEILNKFEVPIEYVVNWTMFWITFSIVFTIFSCGGLWQWLSGECKFAIFPSFAAIGLIAGLMFGAFGGELFKEPTKYETHYQVIITDEVKITEFNERYEILDQEGRIYTVREK